MRWNRRPALVWAALGALALLVFSSADPHLHDELDGQGDHCVLCHAQDAAFVTPGLPASPDPAVCPVVVPVAVTCAHGVAPTGGGSRAPPA